MLLHFKTGEKIFQHTIGLVKDRHDADQGSRIPGIGVHIQAPVRHAAAS
ncbi:hypothetical protein [Paraburkholderia sp. GAS42]